MKDHKTKIEEQFEQQQMLKCIQRPNLQQQNDLTHKSPRAHKGGDEKNGPTSVYVANVVHQVCSSDPQ